MASPSKTANKRQDDKPSPVKQKISLWQEDEGEPTRASAQQTTFLRQEDDGELTKALMAMIAEMSG